MQRLEVSGAVRPIYRSLSVKRLTVASCIRRSSLCRKKYFGMKCGKYYIAAFMRQVVRDKHRPKSDYVNSLQRKVN